MRLALKRVAGIKESVSLVSSRCFAVGAISNKVYTWDTIYDVQSSQDEESDDL